MHSHILLYTPTCPYTPHTYIHSHTAAHTISYILLTHSHTLSHTPVLHPHTHSHSQTHTLVTSTLHTLHTRTHTLYTYTALTQTTHTRATHTDTHCQTHTDTHHTHCTCKHTLVHCTYCTRSHTLTLTHTHCSVLLAALSVWSHLQRLCTCFGKRCASPAPSCPPPFAVSPPVSAAPSLFLFEWTCLYVSTCPGQSHLKQCQRHLHSIT